MYGTFFDKKRNKNLYEKDIYTNIIFKIIKSKKTNLTGVNWQVSLK